MKDADDQTNILSRAMGSFRTTALDEQLPREGDLICGSRIERVLGQGAIGRVYLTYNPEIDARRAVKMLFPGFTRDNVHRLREEAKIYAKFDSPNIVRMYSIGTWENDLPYIEMEYIDGYSLEHLIEKQIKIPQPVALSVCIIICQALDYAYKMKFTVEGVEKEGVIHRDIKPANILFTSGGDVKLVDFGLARIGNISTYTKDTQTPGSFPYMSPEQHACDLDSISHRSDLYSLGIVLYEMMTGRRPFPEDGIDTQINAKNKELYQPLKNKVPETLDSVETLLKKTLRAQPDKRWDRHGTLLMALKSSLGELTARTPASIIHDYVRDPVRFKLVEAPRTQKTNSKLLITAGVVLAILILAVGAIVFMTGKNTTQNPVAVVAPTPDVIPATAPAPMQPIETQSVSSPGDSSIETSLQPLKTTTENAPVIAQSVDKQQASQVIVPQTSGLSTAFEQRLKRATIAHKSSNWSNVVKELVGAPRENLAKTTRDSITLLLLEAYWMQSEFGSIANILQTEREIFDAQYYLCAGLFYTNLSQYSKAREAFDKAVRMPTVMGVSVKAKAWLQRAKFLENSLDTSIPDQKQVVQNAWKDYLKNVCKSSGGTTADCEHARTYVSTP